MRNTEIICVMDRSYSMTGSEGEVISAYNEFIKGQKKLKNVGSADVTLIFFDNVIDTMHSRVPLREVPKLTNKQYTVRGCTALFDAVGFAINSVNPKKKNVILMIQTDGEENSSQEYTGDQVRQLVKAKEEMGWDVRFIGSDLSQKDAIRFSSVIGIDVGKTVVFNKSEVGFADMTRYMASNTSAYRGDGAQNGI